MAIDFFDPNCTTKTAEEIFGIYDVPPATLDFENSEIWVAWVDNKHKTEITFTAIDGCVEIPRYEGKRCEALISYEKALIFIELKDRDGGRWAGEAREQLKNTIHLFNRDVGIVGYKKLYSYISIKQRPAFRSGGKAFSQQFEDETGFILKVSQMIEIV